MDEFWICNVDFIKGFCFQFIKRTDNLQLSAVRTFPDRYRDTPVSLSWNCPVTGIVYPVVESAFSGPFRYPFNFSDFIQHFLLDVGNFKEPLFGCTVNDRSFTSPAYSVSVLNGFWSVHQAFIFQIFDDLSVFFFCKFVSVFACFISKASVFTYRTENWNSISFTDFKIVRTVSRCGVYKTCTFAEFNMVTRQYPVNSIYFIKFSMFWNFIH